MIAKKIYEHAKLHVDGDFPWVHAKRWLDEAQTKIASSCDTGNIKDNVTIVVTIVDQWYSLPSNTIMVSKVLLDGYSTNEYKEDTSRIFLPEIGTYSIEYKKLPKSINLESDTPELHELYHFPMSYWVASREQYRFNPDSPDGARLEQTFYNEINQVDKMISRTSRVRKIKV